MKIEIIEDFVETMTSCLCEELEEYSFIHPCMDKPFEECSKDQQTAWALFKGTVRIIVNQSEYFD